MRQTDEISHIVQEIRHGNIGRITLGANGTLARYIIPQIYSKFKQDYPGVELILHIGNSRQIFQKTLDREVDFGFAIGDTIPPGLKAKTLIRDEMIIVVGQKHPLANEKKITSQDLSKHPFIIPMDEEKDLNVMENLLNLNGIVINKRMMEIDDTESIKRVLMCGIGVGALLGQCVSEELQTGKLIKVNLSNGPFIIDLHFLSRQDKYPSPMHKKFIKFFETQIKQIPIPTLS